MALANRLMLVPGIKIPWVASGILPPWREETHPISVRIMNAEKKRADR